MKFWNLPPVATHLACFLLGSLLFVPDGAGRVPPGILVPWVATRIEGEVRVTAEYLVLSAAKHCLLISDSLKLWRAEEKKLFVLVGKSRSVNEILAVLQKADARLIIRPASPTAAPIPNCERSNAIIYP